MGCGGSKEEVVSQPVDAQPQQPTARPSASPSQARHLAPVAGVNLDGIIAAEFDIKVIAGRNLAPKDGGGLLGGERTSDPYCVVRYRKLAEKSPHVPKNLNPTWNWSTKIHLQGRDFKARSLATDVIRICIFDYDNGVFDSDDPARGDGDPNDGLFLSPPCLWHPCARLAPLRNVTEAKSSFVLADGRRGPARLRSSLWPRD